MSADLETKQQQKVGGGGMVKGSCCCRTVCADRIDHTGHSQSGGRY